MNWTKIYEKMHVSKNKIGMWLGLDDLKNYMKKNDISNNLNTDGPIKALGIFKITKTDKHHWIIKMKGPDSSIYKNGVFTINIDFPIDFPQKKPEIKIINKIYHLQVSPRNGHISFNICNRWNPNTSISELLVSLYLFLLYEQDPLSPYNAEAAEEYVINHDKFIQIAEKYILKYSSPSEEDLQLIKIMNMSIKIISEEENKKRNEQINNILKRQKEKRNKADNTNIINEEEREKYINETIEDMSIMGTIIKDQILYDRQTNPEKYIQIKEAIKTGEKNNPLFIVGLLAQTLENEGITTAIEKEINNKNEEETSTYLQFLVNGYATKKKYILHFDFEEERNNQLLNNKKEQELFNDKLRKTLAKEYNIKENDIIISFPQKGSYETTIIFKSNNFINLDKKELLEKFKYEPELGKLKDLYTDLILSGCKLNKNMFDSKGNNKDGGWGINEKRGGEPYLPPIGWIRYGLNFLGKYDNGNNNWLSHDNRKGEWCVAYHGVAQGQSSDNVKKVVGLIANSNLKQGKGQCYSNYDDYRHKGEKVKDGVYCTPDPKIVIEDGYAGVAEINNEKYYMAFMLRVNPQKIRAPVNKKDYWVLNGLDSEIRPYGILIKKKD